jgi:hypothetical protein
VDVKDEEDEDVDIMEDEEDPDFPFPPDLLKLMSQKNKEGDLLDVKDADPEEDDQGDVKDADPEEDDQGNVTDINDADPEEDDLTEVNDADPEEAKADFCNKLTTSLQGSKCRAKVAPSANLQQKAQSAFANSFNSMKLASMESTLVINVLLNSDKDPSAKNIKIFLDALHITKLAYKHLYDAIVATANGQNPAIFKLVRSANLEYYELAEPRLAEPRPINNTTTRPLKKHQQNTLEDLAAFLNLGKELDDHDELGAFYSDFCNGNESDKKLKLFLSYITDHAVTRTVLEISLETSEPFGTLALTEEFGFVLRKENQMTKLGRFGNFTPKPQRNIAFLLPLSKYRPHAVRAFAKRVIETQYASEARSTTLIQAYIGFIALMDGDATAQNLVKVFVSQITKDKQTSDFLLTEFERAFANQETPGADLQFTKDTLFVLKTFIQPTTPDPTKSTKLTTRQQSALDDLASFWKNEERVMEQKDLRLFFGNFSDDDFSQQAIKLFLGYITDHAVTRKTLQTSLSTREELEEIELTEEFGFVLRAENKTGQFGKLTQKPKKNISFRVPLSQQRKHAVRTFAKRVLDFASDIRSKKIVQAYLAFVALMDGNHAAKKDFQLVRACVSQITKDKPTSAFLLAEFEHAFANQETLGADLQFTKDTFFVLKNSKQPASVSLLARPPVPRQDVTSKAPPPPPTTRKAPPPPPPTAPQPPPPPPPTAPQALSEAEQSALSNVASFLVEGQIVTVEQLFAMFEKFIQEGTVTDKKILHFLSYVTDHKQTFDMLVTYFKAPNVSNETGLVLTEDFGFVAKDYALHLSLMKRPIQFEKPFAKRRPAAIRRAALRFMALNQPTIKSNDFIGKYAQFVNLFNERRLATSKTWATVFFSKITSHEPTLKFLKSALEHPSRDVKTLQRTPSNNYVVETEAPDSFWSILAKK